MPRDPQRVFTDEMIVPLKELLVQVAMGVAEAQRALDQQSMQLQKELYTNRELEDLRIAGVESTWYQIPEVTASLKVAISIHSEGESDGAVVSRLKPLHLRLAPYNARYKNSYDYDCEGTSTMNFKIVPIPSPVGASLTVVPNLAGKTEEEAIKALGEASLMLGDVSEKESEEPSGRVIGQDPEAATQVNVGETVDITLSKSN
jgi:hypothetical protein